MTFKELIAKRASLSHYYNTTFFRTNYILHAIAERSAAETDAQFENLYNLLTNEDLIYQAIEKLRKNDGTSTAGIDGQTLDEMTNAEIESISKELKERKFKFKPIKRVYIDKKLQDQDINKIAQKLAKKGELTKDKIKELGMRPLGVPTFRDRIVQEAIRLILDAIYEPVFERRNANFGFRPGKGCHDAIIRLEEKAKSMYQAIEGDIEGAYDNLNHDILMTILAKKIKDKKLLALIRQGLECGVFFAGTTSSSELGVTQGSIVSPLLFNIYMNEFDDFIHNTIMTREQARNEEDGRIPRAINPLYNYLSKKKSLLRFSEKIKFLKSAFLSHGKDSQQYKEAKEKYTETRTTYQNLDKKQKSIKSSRNYRRQLIRTIYVRYADDWIVLTNGPREYAEKIKEDIAGFLFETLKLKLSPTKTKVTDIRKDHARFLGFQLKNGKVYDSNKLAGNTEVASRALILRGTINRVKKENPQHVYRARTINPNIIIAWDRERILGRLEQKRFIARDPEKSWRGRTKPEWTTLEAHEIIQRYNWVISGLANYIGPVSTFKLDFQQLHYLLTYSCYHTLASKFRCRISEVINRFGKDIQIKWEEKSITRKKGEEKKIERTKIIKLINWERAKEIIKAGVIRKIEKKKYPVAHLDQILTQRVNFRTKYKLSLYCCVCGSTTQVEYHHIRHVRIGKARGFLKVMSQLNRKQIPVCKPCHDNIHSGRYDDMALTDLYDEQLIIL